LGAIGLITAVALLSGAFPRHWFTRRIIDVAGDRQAFYFMLIWFVVAYLAFIFLSPATSFVDTRLMLVLAVPGYLLFAQCLAVAARIVSPRFSIAMAPLVALAFLGIRGAAVFTRSSPPAVPGLEAVVDAASRWTLAPGTKVYTWPNENLLLTYLTGLPVQSVAPVRKAFLDEYPGDLIFVETGTAYTQSPLTDAQTIARKQGRTWSVDDAREADLRVQRFGAHQYLKDCAAPPRSSCRTARSSSTRGKTATSRSSIAPAISLSDAEPPRPPRDVRPRYFGGLTTT